MLLAWTVAVAASQSKMPYLNPSLSVEVRAKDLVGRMTLAEKVSQMVHGAKAIPRLGVPAYNWWNEALHGVARNGTATVFPQPIGLAATFQPDLIHQMGVATSDEARAKFHDQFRKTGSSGNYQGLTMWAPNINIFRDPRWGRGHETYGEDPFLTSRMGVAYITGMQGDDRKYLKTVATPKHYAVHSGPDPLRHQFNATPTKRDLWNTYLPAFEACITEGKAWSIMSSYNRVDGAPSSANTVLLEDILRKKWGFQGYVVSDCGAINDIVNGHHYAKTYAEASADAVNAGCDLECGGAYHALVQAVDEGLIKEAEIDKSLTRLMEARIKLGLFDPPSMVKYAQIPMSVVESPAHQKLARNLAEKSIVLLKNSGTLPLKSSVKSIAVIGPNADVKETLWGNYNGIPTYTVTPLAGIRKLAEARKIKVNYARGCTITGVDNVEVVPTSAFAGPLKRELFRNKTLEGTPELGEAKNIDENWGEDGPAKDLKDNFSIRWTGKLKAPTTGVYNIGLKADDGARLWIDGKLLEEDWTNGAARLKSGQVTLQAGQVVEIKAEYFESEQYASCQLMWTTPGQSKFADAVEAAKSSDVVVACMGLSPAQEDEEGDRTSIELPAVQTELLKALKATGKPVVLVLVNGGPVSSTWADGNLSAIMESWYGGQEAGTAIAESLFGLNNPAGRLPVTVYHSTSELPDFSDYHMTNRTYRYDARKPLYPFGFGLSYSKFMYSVWKGPKKLAIGKDFVGRVKVTNMSNRDGDEVVQFYLSRHDKDAAIRELRWFKRVSVPAKKSVWVDVRLSAKDLAEHDDNGKHVLIPEKLTATIGGCQPGTPGLSAPLNLSFELTGQAKKW
ncbi:MAG: glycoside hydrolase family 3 C-terminal domain-containing protein [Armatimonadetes bacterium]|nr:glycoside hydrolase family 3 C-terminal domain-containing protein [Armatimonadota bacterium]